MISAIIIAKDEEKVISRCIESLSWCKEIIVIDNNSSDKTAQLAKQLGVKVYTSDIQNDFAKLRNFALTKTTNTWALFIDADEVVSPELASEINNLKLADNNYDGFCVHRTDFWHGKEIKYGETGQAKFLRLAKVRASKWRRAVHENWSVEGEVFTLKNPIFHYPHPTLSEFLKDINFYSTLHAEANFKEEKRSNILKILSLPILKFINNYFLKLGFLDGLEGFVIASFMSLHSFLGWSKLWFIQRK